MVTQQKTTFHQLLYRLRRLWRHPGERPFVTPALAGTAILSATSLGLTFAGWMMIRLLPNREFVSGMAASLPDGFFALLKSLPELWSQTVPSTVLVTGAVVSQEAFILTYACGAASLFCLLLLAVAFVRKW